MTIENYLQEAGMLATLAGILGGFAFSAVVQLLASENRDKITTATVVTFSLCSLIAFYAVIVFVLVFSASAEANAVIQEIDDIGTFALIALFGAIFIFLTGVAMAGWIRSKATGVATTVLAVITMCMVSYAIFRVGLIAF